jgi:hypothetical protein
LPLGGPAQYVNRNNDSGGSNFQVTTMVWRLAPIHISRAGPHAVPDLLSWNVLDFGVSYYRAQQRPISS